MDHQIKANLYPCAHCSETGTCSSGVNGSSCLACVTTNDLKGKELYGLACGVCNGLGLAEPRTERMNKRIKPILAMALIFSLLGGIFVSAMLESPYFSQILAFSGTLLGSIVGYYFSIQRGRDV